VGNQIQVRFLARHLVMAPCSNETCGLWWDHLL
jgi:hypothetical protein